MDFETKSFVLNMVAAGLTKDEFDYACLRAGICDYAASEVLHELDYQIINNVIVVESDRWDEMSQEVWE